MFVGLVEQFEQFQYGFAREDDFGFRQVGFNGGGRVGQAVAVGRYQTELVSFGLHQQAVQIIADVLYGHAVLDLRQHTFECFLCQRKCRADFLSHAHQREVFGRQGLQGEARFAGFQHQAVLRPIQSNLRSFGKRAQDVLKFFCVGGDTEIARFAFRAVGVDLNFQVGGQDVGLTVCTFEQDVG